MNTWMLYLVQRLDALQSLATLIVILSIAVIVLVITAKGISNREMTDKERKLLTALLIVFVSMLGVNLLVPTTKQAQELMKTQQVSK